MQLPAVPAEVVPQPAHLGKSFTPPSTPTQSWKEPAGPGDPGSATISQETSHFESLKLGWEIGLGELFFFLTMNFKK